MTRVTRRVLDKRGVCARCLRFCVLEWESGMHVLTDNLASRFSSVGVFCTSTNGCGSGDWRSASYRRRSPQREGSSASSWWAFGARVIIAPPGGPGCGAIRRSKTRSALAQSIEANTRPTFAARAVVGTDSSEGPDRNGNYHRGLPVSITGRRRRLALRRICSGEMLALKRNALRHARPRTRSRSGREAGLSATFLRVIQAVGIGAPR